MSAESQGRDGNGRRSEAPELWSFRVDGWELGDTLGDITRGQRLELVLCFYPLDARRSHAFREADVVERTAARVEWNRYEVTGEIVFRGKESWILDFGIPAVCQNRWPAPAGVGGFVSGRIQLGSLTAGVWGEDVFEPPAPPLDFVWQVERVWLETTPWVTVGTGGQRATVEASFTEVEATNYANDDDGRADYLLDCRIVGGPSRN